eukprot:4816280-Heterocapsa_arctica.AAC.1
MCVQIVGACTTGVILTHSRSGPDAWMLVIWCESPSPTGPIPNPKSPSDLGIAKLAGFLNS